MIKGIVLAGGTGSRLMPLTKVVNKSLLPVYDKPLIYYPIITLRDSGIKEILIIAGKEHAGQYLDLLGDGRELGVKITYTLQNEPKGIAHGLALAEDFADGQPVVLILGDNIFENTVKFEETGGAKIFLKEVVDPQRFGIAKFEGDKLVDIIEKPVDPPSNWAVTGLYYYDKQVFDVIRVQKPSARGEYEISDVNQWYVFNDMMQYEKINGDWIDCGTFDSLLKASNLMANKKTII